MRPLALALAIGTLALAASAAPAQARPDCATAIIEEWASGTLASQHPLDCYDAAIDALPEDLRAYTTAADDISRAAVAASRADVSDRELASAPVAESARAFPTAVALLGLFVAVLAASGLAASLLRRRRAR